MTCTEHEEMCNSLITEAKIIIDWMSKSAGKCSMWWPGATYNSDAVLYDTVKVKFTLMQNAQIIKSKPCNRSKSDQEIILEMKLLRDEALH